MLKNYLIIAFRNLLKHKAYTVINIMGLSIGISCCMIIFLFVQDEFSYDRFHAHAERIGRFTREFSGSAPLHFPYTPLPLVPALQAEFPGIQTMRIMGNGPWSLVQASEKQFREIRIYWADGNFFDFFTFPLIKGNPKTALTEPNTIVITEEMAHKYFGNGDPLGKMLSIDNTFHLKVTGVMVAIPHNTHFHPDFLGSFSTHEATFSPQRRSTWGNNFLYTYFMLPYGYTIEHFRDLMPQFLQRHAEDAHKKTLLHVQRMTDIHLHSNLDGELEPNGSISMVYILSIIGVFILLIACVNYMNLATARAAGRTKEVGIRKTLGAYRGQLVLQFMMEAALLSFVAVLVGMALVESALPFLHHFSGKELVGEYNKPVIAGVFILIGLVVGLFSGSYPALVLSGFRPVLALKAGPSGQRSGVLLRKILVVGQFCISTALIISTATVYSQMMYLKNKKLGFNKEHTVIVDIPDSKVQQQYETIKTAFQSVPGVYAIASASPTPAQPLLNSNAFIPADKVPATFDVKNNMAEAEQWITHFAAVDDNFFPAMSISVIAGRNFSKELTTNSAVSMAFMMNESAVKKYGWKSPQEAVGKELLQFPDGVRRSGYIVGVVRDFHMESLREPIRPVIFIYQPNQLGNYIIKISGQNIPATIAGLTKKWREQVPAWPIVYRFLDDDFEALYRSEENMSTIFAVFSLLAIFIACLGLFGLAAFMTEQRTKEIGIRKVLGATVPSIVLLLGGDFLRLVGYAFVLAAPLAYFLMSSWLRNFAYRIEMGVGIFMLAGAIAVLIAWLTVSYQSVKAALANPVRALKYE